jgi:hypothetical protein
MREGSTPKLTVSIVTPDGEVVSFSTSNPQGILMPGCGDDNHESMHRGGDHPGKPDLLPYGKSRN